MQVWSSGVKCVSAGLCVSTVWGVGVCVSVVRGTHVHMSEMCGYRSVCDCSLGLGDR